MKDLKRGIGVATATVALLLGLSFVAGLAAAPHPGPPFDLPPVPFDVESAIGVATGAGGTGAATFVFAEGADHWAALVVRAGSPDGVERVTVTFETETRTLTIQLEDSRPTNVASVLINEEFVATLIETAEEEVIIEVSQAVNYEGVGASEDAGGAQVYVFAVTHFSVQTIRISSQAIPGDTFMGANGLTALGWVMVGAAVILVTMAAVVALRKRE